MNFFRKTGNEAYVDGFDRENDRMEPVQPASPAYRSEEKRMGSGNLEMTVMNPTEYADVTNVAAALLRGTTVVLNLEAVAKEVARRFLDFLGGVVYSINGNIKKVAATTYIIAPKNVDVYDSSRSLNLEAGDMERENIGDFAN